MITSLIIQEIKNIDSVHVCFFYCNYCDNQKISLTNVLRSILFQLVQQDEDLLQYVYDEFLSISSDEAPVSLHNTIEQLLKTSVRDCRNTCIIIDGIDECGVTEEAKIIAWFLAVSADVTKDNAGTMRLLFVSRKGLVREDLLSQAAIISLDSEHHRNDIQDYALSWSWRIDQKFGFGQSSASLIGTSVAAQAEGERDAKTTLTDVCCTLMI